MPSLEATGSMIEYNSVQSASPTLVIGRGAGEPDNNQEMKKTSCSLKTKKNVFFLTTRRSTQVQLAALLPMTL